MKNSNHTELRNRARNAANRFERTRTRNAMAAVALAMGTLACGMSATALAQARAPEVEATTNTSALADGLTRQDQGHTDRLIVRMKRPMVASGPQHAATGKAPAEAAVATRALLGAQTEQRRALTARLQSRTPETLTPHRTMGDGSHVLRLNRRLPPDEIRAIAARLAQDPDVLDILPDRVFYPALTPTDPRYATDQWYLSATNGINMPGAWDITTGSPSLVIGLIDTGLLPHNDLAGRTVPGYDFVSLTARENDTATQPGRDTDPTDPGDACLGTDTASWHGTTMAGVIAANANNGGIAGINWQSKILPIRAVGKCGGYESDIVDALRWAVGIAVAGVTTNPNPAKVINMSLAASSPAATGGCASNVTPPNTTPLQTAINEVLALNVPVIAAAGNNSGSAADYAPGNCAGVITVGTVDKNGGKPTYMNVGTPTTPITISAPGGSGVNTCNADPLNACHSAANILTTHNAGAMTADSNYDYLKATSGTSIAAAMVTGVVSLMRGIDPLLTPGEIAEILANTSRPFPAGTASIMPNPSQADCTVALCGAGIVDALRSVLSARAWRNTPAQVAGGSLHSIGLRSDGVVFGWGKNIDGQLGIGPGPASAVPVQALINGVTKVSAGSDFTVVLRADGTVWTWGRNDFGQLGDGSTSIRNSPVRVQGLANVMAVAAGGAHVVALKLDGTVWTWGANGVGQLGIGTTVPSLVPVQVPGLTGVSAIAVTASHVLALKNGVIWGWGNNLSGQVGNGSVNNLLSPVQTSILDSVVAIAAGAGHSIALKQDGTFWAWGAGGSGAFGNGTIGQSNVPLQISGITDVAAISAGAARTMILKNDGTIWSWGLNVFGQLGDGTNVDRLTPVQVLGLSNMVSINTSTREHALAIKNDGSVWTWGRNDNLQLGNGNIAGNGNAAAPVLGAGGSGLLSLDLAATNFVAIFNAAPGSVQTSNTMVVNGIANGSSISVMGGEYRIDGGAFTALSGTINAGQSVSIRQTASSNCGEMFRVTLLVAGVPRYFDVTTTACDVSPDPFLFTAQFSVPPSAEIISNTVTISGITPAAPISIVGGSYSIGCTGSFSTAASTIVAGQTVCVKQTASPNPTTLTTATLNVGSYSAPFDVVTQTGAGFNTPAQVAGGSLHSIGLRSDGVVFGWGKNIDGQLGIGPGPASAVPVQALINGVTKVSAGSDFTVVLRADGTVWTWGRNDFGQLGDGSTSIRNSPVRVQGLANVMAVAAGGAHVVALKLDGTVWTWGANGVGQLGIGTTVPSLVPVQVPGLTGVSAIAVTASHVLALKNGVIWGWGNNLSGQVGNGSVNNLLSPVQTSILDSVVAIAAGAGHSIALKQDGTFWAWGAGGSGAFGNGTIGQSNVPLQISGITDVAAISAGAARTMILKNDGTIWSWGLNVFGQLGDGTNVDRLTPVQVLGLSNMVSINTSTREHALAIKNDGSVWTWGRNDNLQLGNGNIAGNGNAAAPVLGAGGSGLLSLDLAATNFVAIFNAAPGSVQTSNTMVVNGIANGSSISVMGGEYRIDGGAFTALSGTINAGQSVSIRQTASSNCGEMFRVTLLVAGVPRYFDVTTTACDVSPDPFLFTAQFSVPPSAEIISNTVTISGITPAAPISIVGGSYSIGCTGSFSTAASTIVAGQTVCVKQTASPNPTTLTTATLNVGSYSAPFDVVTQTGAGFNTPAQVAGGSLHSIGLRSDGVVFGWGKNIDGQLGIGPGPASAVPVQALINGVTKVSAGSDFTVVLRADGTVWTWGRNDFGQLGDGSTSIRNSPVRVQGLANVMAVAAGGAHVVALKLDGTVWTWGANGVGQLGIGTTVPSLVPVQVPGLTGVSAIAVTASHVLALKNGVIWGWGNNLSGQVGNGSVNNLLSPVQTSILDSVVAIAAGAGHSIALKQDGTFWAWGAGGSGAFGNGTIGQSNVPLQISGITDVAAISAGAARTMILKNDGTIWSWGLNVFGQLGDGTNVDRLTPVQVLGLSNMVSINTSTREHALAIKNDGSVWTWGRNDNLQLGNGNIAGNGNAAASVTSISNDDYFRLFGSDNLPDPIAFVSGLGVMPTAVSTSNTIIIGGLGQSVQASITITGGEYSINGGTFTTAPGTVVNGNTVVVRVQSSSSFSATTSATLTIGGASGRSSTFYVRTRNDPSARAIIPQVALGNSHSYVLSSNGTVYAVGYNGNGQLGNGTTFSTPLFRPVAGLGKITAIAAGANHGLALRDDRTISVWGYNAGGQLGSGADTNSERYFVNVSSLTDIIAIAAGEYHSLVLKQDGTVWAWGLNVDGQVGQGNTTTSRYLAPVQVKGIGGTGFLTGVTAIGAGNRHNLAVLIDGTVVAWGANTSGQLGNNSTTASSSPITISGLTNIVALAAGGNHSLAIKNDASLLAWGDNAFGQLGVGDIANRLTPVAIPGLTQIGRIAAGATHSLAVKTGGALYAWGNNANRQLDFAESANPNVTPSPNRTSPQLVSSVPNVFAISAGGRHSAAQRANGELRLWGDNFFGQLGNKSGNFNPHSAALNVLRGDSQISGFGGSATSSSGATSTSGSAIIDIAGLATDYDFGDRVQGSPTTISGSFKNQALTGDITAVGINVVNTGGSAYSLQTNTCGATLPAGMECSFTVAFNPNTAGDLTGRLEVASSLIGSPEVRQLFGKGIAPASPGLRLTSTGNLNYFLFEPQTVGTQSTTRPLTIANTGNATLNVSSITLTNGQNDFTVVNPTACASVAAGMSCNLDLQFNPIAPNAPNIRSGLVSIATNAGTQTVALEGAAAPSDAVVSGLMLIGAMSRKDHGTAQTPNLQPLIIDRTKTINQAISIEPRSIGAGHQIVFQFNGTITNPGIATLTDKDNQPITTALVTTAPSNNDVIVTIANLPDATRVTINLTNVNGTSAANSSIALGFLVGDINGSGKVTGADIAGIKARQSGSVTSSNYKADINVSGAINNVDVSAVKARAGRGVP